MPELPEVETVRRGLSPRIVGRIISDIVIRERRFRLPLDASFRRRICGRRILNLRRRGKYLVFEFNEIALIAHLGMSGVFYFSDSPPDKARHEHVGFKIEKEFLIYKDPRRFGCIVLCDSPDSHPLLQKLGPEPLSAAFSGSVLREKLRGRKTPIKTALMDGKVVAGIGNIYASESLYLAGVNPQTAAGELSSVRAEKLAAAIKNILRRAIRAGGSTMRDFAKADGAPGYFQMQWKVYGRENTKCTCGGIVKKITQNSRATYYCPRCQK